MQTVWWEPGAVCLIDQTKLPHTRETVRCTSVAATATAIKHMVVRGAPAIGITAAYGMVIAAQAAKASTSDELISALTAAKTTLDAARPTAVNLRWATDRMLALAHALSRNTAINDLIDRLLSEAHAIRDEDEAMCYAIGEWGAKLLPEGTNVLTHCNAGGLATAGYGTALAPIKTAHSQGRRVHVFVDETRPFLQGARLTTWELQDAGIPQTLITDNMAGYFMRQGAIDCIIVGADRIVANGDVANKIGTYSLAVLAQAHQIPFYVAAPTSTIDLDMANGDAIPIEQRDPREVMYLAGQLLAPEGVQAAHPAFDVTPHTLIKAIITERGIIEPPFEENIRRMMEQSASDDSVTLING
jgi:methylthioribose-1-phosphate isomerase